MPHESTVDENSPMTEDLHANEAPQTHPSIQHNGAAAKPSTEQQNNGGC